MLSFELTGISKDVLEKTSAEYHTAKLPKLHEMVRRNIEATNAKYKERHNKYVGKNNVFQVGDLV